MLDGGTIRLRLVREDGALPRRERLAPGAWYHRGRSHDVEIWAILRAEHDGATGR